MRISVNGKPKELDEGASVLDLLQQLGLQPRRVAVERNKRIVRRNDFDDTVLTDGDEVEIVTLVGGG